MEKFKAIKSRTIELTLIDNDNIDAVRKKLKTFQDADYFIAQLERSYLPRFDNSERRTKYGFYTMFDGRIAGMSLLGISDWENRRGYTGADTLAHMRGQGIAPKSKPLLFYLAFEHLELNRIETGCFVSNTASKSSIEKTPGFTLEGTLRKYALNDKGEFEDEYRYAILKKDWLEIRDNYDIRIIR
jgi:RimJ/RimL family protein N-acetyltransferase